MRNFVMAVLLVALCAALHGQARAAARVAQEALPVLIETALANNPELKALESQWRMFAGRVEQAGALEDPILMMKIQNGIVRAPFDFRKDSMTQKVIGISQQFPFWGKRELRKEVASREADSYRWAVAERRLELIRMVKETWYQIYSTDMAMEIVDRNIRILDDFVTLAETRYSVGQGAQQDIFKAQVERSGMLEMRISLEQRRRSLQANMNLLLYRPADTPMGTIPGFEIKPLTESDEEMRRMAFENRPRLKALDSLVEKGIAGQKLARKEYLPDFNVSLEYMQRDPAMEQEGLDMYSFGLTFNLPVQRARRRAAIVEAEAGSVMAKEELYSLKNAINYGIADLRARMERRRKLIELYRSGIIPQAEKSLESAVIGYRVNKVDFLTLLDNRLTLFNYEREYYDSLADYQMLRAQLEALVGGDLP
jgi:outer membrane protein, heavy metal efflux system